MEYFTCDKLKDIFNIYIYGFAYTNKLGNQSVQDNWFAQDDFEVVTVARMQAIVSGAQR